MNPTPDHQTSSHDESNSPSKLDALIAKQVLQSLGSPRELLKVKVHPVGKNRYRVNVLVGKDFGVARITHSFFLTANESGKIVSSSPEIVRLH